MNGKGRTLGAAPERRRRLHGCAQLFVVSLAHSEGATLKRDSELDDDLAQVLGMGRD